jgi:pimeloyl-ACP methyl ester carboxylesterase
MEKVLSKDGTSIAFDRTGGGSPVILVGGAFQHRAIDPPTAQLAELLGESFTVFHYDRRGRVDSTDTAPYAVEREVEDLDALIDGAGGSACVFGMSSGGALALEAAGSGLAITKLAVYEPPFVVDDSLRPPDDMARRYSELTSTGRRGDAVELFMADFPDEVVAQVRSTPIWPALEGVAHTLAYDATLMGDGSVPTERVASLTAPTLVINGGAGFAWMTDSAQALADALPNARRRTLEGQSHDVAPDVLAPVLAEFFAD